MEMDERTALTYLEHPSLLLRDFPAEGSRLRALRAMERLAARAERENSLAWQAYQARLRRRPRTSGAAAARKIR